MQLTVLSHQKDQIVKRNKIVCGTLLALCLCQQTKTQNERYLAGLLGSVGSFFQVLLVIRVVPTRTESSVLQMERFGSDICVISSYQSWAELWQGVPPQRQTYMCDSDKDVMCDCPLWKINEQLWQPKEGWKGLAPLASWAKHIQHVQHSMHTYMLSGSRFWVIFLCEGESIKGLFSEWNTREFSGKVTASASFISIDRGHNFAAICHCFELHSSNCRNQTLFVPSRNSMKCSVASKQINMTLTVQSYSFKSWGMT